jgi:hypothetical protein
MPAQYPGIGFPPDSTVSLLRKICNNTALIAAGGGGGGGVTSILAGAGISVDQTTGAVTVSVTGTAGNAYHSDVVVAGITITPTASNYVNKLTFSGAAGTYDVALNPTSAHAGDKVRLDCVFPATAGLIITVWGQNTLITKLLPVESFGAGQNFTTDGNVLSACWDFVFDGAAWQYEMSNLPA